MSNRGWPRPADAREWYHLALAPQAKADDKGDEPAAPSHADVYLYDVIGGWFGADANAFVRDVAGLDVDELTVHLNSPGGDAAEGVAIANVLRQHRAKVTVRVDGIAASAASVVAMAGDEVIMSPGAQLMIHDAWSIGLGDADEMRKVAASLDSTSNALASTYAAKAGGTTAEWREVMKSEAWYGPDEAVEAGLADRVAEPDEYSTSGEQVTPGESSGLWDLWGSLRDPQRWDLAALGFAYAGRAQAPAPALPGRDRAAPAAGAITNERSGPVPTFLDDVRQRLGVAADADEATVLAALDKTKNDLGAAEALLAEQKAKAELPEGVVAVDKAQLDALRADAAAGREARAQQEREGRERLVAAAISDGRIAPARREHWIAALEADAGMADVLAGLEKGLIPVNGAIGHDGEPERGDLDAYALIYGKDA